MDKSRCVTVSGLPNDFEVGQVMAIFEEGAVITGHAKLPGKLIIEFESSSQAEASSLFAGFDVDIAGNNYTIDVNDTTDDELKQVAPPTPAQTLRFEDYDLQGGDIKSEDISRIVKVSGLPSNYSDKDGHELLKMFGGPAKVTKSYAGSSGYLLEFKSVEEAHQAKINYGLNFKGGHVISVDEMTKDDASAFNLKLSDDEWVRVESREETLSPIKGDKGHQDKEEAEQRKKEAKLKEEAEAKKASEAKEKERVRIEEEEKARKRAEEAKVLERETAERVRKEQIELERKVREAEEADRLKKVALEKEENERRMVAASIKNQEETSKREADEKSKREADEKSKREAEEKSKREADEKSKREAEEARLARVRVDEETKRREESEKQRRAEEEKKRVDDEKKLTKTDPESVKPTVISPDIGVHLDGDVLKQRFSNLEDRIKNRPAQPDLPKRTDSREYARPDYNLKSTSLIEIAQDFVQIRDRVDGIEKGLIVFLVLVFLRAVWITVAN